MREVAGRPLLAELEDDLLGAVDEVGHLAVALLPEADDLLAGADEPAQRRHLLDDARVVLDVRRGGTSAASSATRAWPPAASSSPRSSSSSTSVIASTGSPFAHSASAARYIFAWLSR